MAFDAGSFALSAFSLALVRGSFNVKSEEPREATTILLCIAAFFRFFTALGDAQRYVEERRLEEERLAGEPAPA
jgi:hypothetical protein